jgi:predicted N-acyltransferase
MSNISFSFLQKDLGFSAFSAPSLFSIPKCRRTVSKKICSVMTPQQSERKPSTTGSVGFLSFFSHQFVFFVNGFDSFVDFYGGILVNFRSRLR